MTLDELRIHKQLAQTLSRALAEDRVPHAQYIQGIDGGGSLNLALAYAQSLLAGSADMFGGVDTRASRLEHPDLHFIFPMVQSVDKTADSSLAEFREFYLQNPYTSYEQWVRHRGDKNRKAIISKHEAENVTKKLSLRSFEGGRKVLIIWMAELMNLDCANKLLKLIEEPPKGAVILMLGSDTNALLPTIQSRTQLIKVKPLEPAEIASILQEQSAKSEEDLMAFALKSEGSIAKAMDLLQSNQNSGEEAVIEWLRLCYQRKVQLTMEWCDIIASQGREEALRTLRCSQEVFYAAFRKNYLIQEQAEETELETFTRKFSPFIHANNAEELLKLTDEALMHVERNGNVRIILLDCSFQVMRLLRIPKEERVTTETV